MYQETNKKLKINELQNQLINTNQTERILKPFVHGANSLRLIAAGRRNVPKVGFRVKIGSML